MLIILISMLLSFIPCFLNRICLFNCFSFGGPFFIIIRSRFFISTLSRSKSSSQLIHDFISIWLERDRNFQLNKYQLSGADHPSNTKIGGVCTYHRESLGVCPLTLSNLSQCIVWEGCIGVVYRSSS